MAPSQVQLGSTDGLYMTAEEAASALNVSVPTLYTYVSRKNIRAHKLHGSRVSRYLRSDIEQIKSGVSPSSARDTTPGLTGSSAITLMTEAGSFYRGVSAIDLAEESTFEDVTRLLWDAGEFDPFELPTSMLPAQSEALLSACAGYSALDRAIMLLPAVEEANPRAHDLGKHGFLRSGADILRWFAAWMLGKSAPANLPLHSYVGEVTQCGANLEDAVRRVLILSADQGMHPVTYVARAAASTGATPYRCAIAALSAVTGKRLPTVRVGSFSRFLAEIDSSRDSTEPVRVRVRESEDIPGFGYSPFDAPDPRSAALMKSFRVNLSNDQNFLRFERAISLATDLTGQQPDFALLAAYVNRRVGADPDANLVRLGRIAGWVAHAWEQQNEAPLLRWKVKYNGVLPG